MNPRRLFVRKITYMGVIALLLIPLAWLSRPATGPTGGGKLATMRREYHLSQSNLGEIDPTSESIKLATLGMRGVAATVLWSRANHYKKVEDWTRFTATVEELTKVMPNSVGVWRYQAWNVSYNISVEFDDYRLRYKRVLEGIELLKQGRRYNQHDPRLLWDIGWFTCQKIGRSDERKHFRRMYQEDFHEDNWLVGKRWYLEAQRLVNDEGLIMKGLNPIVFHSHPAMAQIYYGKALNEDGLSMALLRTKSPEARRAGIEATLKRWKAAWQEAGEDWYAGPRSYGNFDLPTGGDFPVRLNDLPIHRKRIGELWETLEQLKPGAGEKLLSETTDPLSDLQKKALKAAPAKRDANQRRLVRQAIKTYVSPRRVAAEITGERHAQAQHIAGRIVTTGIQIQLIQRAGEPVNFLDWKLRCQVEITPAMLAAHRYIHEAQVAHREGRLLPAKELYERGFAEWDQVMRQFPHVLADEVTGDDVLDLIVEYKRLLEGGLNRKFPEDFPLQRVIDRYDFNRVFTPQIRPPEPKE